MFDLFRRREDASLHSRLSDLEVSVRKLTRLVDDLDADLASWKKREGKEWAAAKRAGSTVNGATVPTHGPAPGGQDPALNHPNPRIRALYARRARRAVLPAADAEGGGV